MKTKKQKDGSFFSAGVTVEHRAHVCSKVSTQRERVRVQAVDVQQYSPSARCGGYPHAARVWRSCAAGAGHRSTVPPRHFICTERTHNQAK